MSAFTFYEVEEALYKIVAKTIRDVPNRDVLRTAICRPILTQALAVARLFNLAILSLTAEAVEDVSRSSVLADSGVRAAELELDVGPEGVELSVIDHGRGFDTNAPRSSRSFGLRSMNERAESLGGSCEVTSQVGQGTVVRVVLPIKRQEQPQIAPEGAMHVD